MICKVCGNEFKPKKSNQAYCNILCRIRMGNQRRQWDIYTAYVEQAERAAKHPENSPERRKMWAQWAAKRRIELGERP